MVFPNKPSGTEGITNPLRSLIGPIRTLTVSAQFLGVGIAGLCGVIGLGNFLIGDTLPFGVWIAVGLYGLALGAALAGLRKTYPHPAIGTCNVVTIVRLTLTCALIAALLSPSPAPWAVFAVAGTAFLLDGLDGWLARREGYASTFGARFDVEVDSALALVLALYAYQHADLGAYVILLGLPRYAFVAAQFRFEWLNGALPERFSRKVVCVLQISVLILVLLPSMSAAFANTAAAFAALALIWSFGLDIRWLWMART